MGILYKFASSKNYNSIQLDDAYISVYLLKRKIIELNYKSKKKGDSNGLCLGTDFDIILINAQTGVEYTDDSMLVPDNSSVLIRRVPGSRRHKHLPVDTSTIKLLEKLQPNSASNKKTGSVSVSSGASTLTSSGTNNSVSISLKSSCSSSGIDNSYASKSGSCTTYSGSGSGASFHSSSTSTAARAHANFGSRMIKSENGFCPIPGLPPGKKLYELEDEDLKIQLLVNTSSLPGWGIGNGSVGGGRVVGRMGGYGFWGGLEKKTPPAGYVCRRCGVSGHFIRHCPTNGNPDYDFRRPTPRASIFKSVPMPNPDGREIECPSSSKKSRISSDVPEELQCPLCKQVMTYAVLTSRCCLTSLCDKCIRDHLLLSKLKCVCGETGMLTDYLIPNITVREMIDRFLECGGSGYISHSRHDSAKNRSVENVKSAESSEEVQQQNVTNGMEKKRKRAACPNAGVGSYGMPVTLNA